MNVTQTPLSASAAVFIGLIVLAFVAFEATWSVVRYINTMAHEGAHAMTGSLLFRGVDRITMNAKGEGETVLVRGGALPGTVLFKFVGYVGPSAFGLGAAALIQAGYILSTFWVALVLLVVLLIAVRWSFAFVAVPVALILAFLIARFASVQTQVVAAYAIAWLLLLSGVRVIIEHGLEAKDGISLRDITGIPRLIWSLLWLAGALAAVAFGGRMLVMPA